MIVGQVKSKLTLEILGLNIKVTDSYFYQTNTALYPVKSENSPTTADDGWLLRKQKVDWLL